MITHVKGSLFESPAKVLVNTVNTVGVMGRGIAKTFKEIYPEMFSQYQQLCEKRELQTGKLWLYRTEHKWILNFPTKVHWRQPSKLEYIEQGLVKFVSAYPALGITSIAFPQLGCGNGELDWETAVRPLMTRYLGRLPIDTFIYEYEGEFAKPEHRDVAAMNAWLRSEPRTLAFEEVWRDLCDHVGMGLDLKTWDGEDDFRVIITDRPEHGIQIWLSSKSVWGHLVASLTRLALLIPVQWRPRVIRPGGIFIPKEAMLDLWQNIRAYGFCVPRIMSQGLDLFAPYVMALLDRLDYVRRVELLPQTAGGFGEKEAALQLFVPPTPRPARSSQPAFAVQRV